MRWTRTLATVLALLLVHLIIPQEATAQTCVGSPAPSGAWSFGGGVTLAEGYSSAGAGVLYNLETPLMFGAGFGVTKVTDGDSNAISGGADVGYAFYSETVEVCLLTGVGYSRTEGSLFDSRGPTTTFANWDTGALSVPFGLSAGTASGSDEDSVRLLPWAGGGLLVSRISVEGQTETFSTSGHFVDDISDQSLEADFYAEAGATIAFGRVSGGLTVGATTIQDSSATIGFHLELFF